MIVAIIQARIGSERLPGKVLSKIGSKPMIEHTLDRVSLVHDIDQCIVATTDSNKDDELVKWCTEQNVAVFRGSESDVLDRYYKCALASNAEMIVRITADDPFKDPKVITQAIQILRQNSILDYCSNTLVPTYPEGLDVEVFTFSALERCYHNALLPSEREHVTPYIWKNQNLFQTANFCYKRDLSTLRLTVDEKKDLALAVELNKIFGEETMFGVEDIAELYQRAPSLFDMNRGVQRNHGYILSLKGDVDVI